ncbi:MAG: hypothetical protein EBZ03_05105 [Betaproteobacteria bacterium]|nr:hypothetical protein [Betaproteobacteria bacterium]NBO43877.1 hypothetical protein [Betaproteobacteria bacterium]NBP09613.1 hypothetical protein [Betaproteobacteria bacterium]NBP61029.1 hypothetical protein [Betaproteobacteria bacterium]NBQ08863.1 hypothetical protein [Betaproteobacteria bacterium]
MAKHAQRRLTDHFALLYAQDLLGPGLKACSLARSTAMRFSLRARARSCHADPSPDGTRRGLAWLKGINNSD